MTGSAAIGTVPLAASEAKSSSAPELRSTVSIKSASLS
jgi:hypothetical protein